MATRRATLADVEQPRGGPQFTAGRPGFSRTFRIGPGNFRPERELLDFRQLSSTLSRGLGALEGLVRAENQQANETALEQSLGIGVDIATDPDVAQFMAEIQGDDDAPFTTLDRPIPVFEQIDKRGRPTSFKVAHGGLTDLVTSPPGLSPDQPPVVANQEMLERFGELAKQNLPALANPVLPTMTARAQAIVLLQQYQDGLQRGLTAAGTWKQEDGVVGGPRLDADRWIRGFSQDFFGRHPILENSTAARRYFVAGAFETAQRFRATAKRSLDRSYANSVYNQGVRALVSGFQMGGSVEDISIDANPTAEGREARAEALADTLSRQIRTFELSGALTSSDQTARKMVIEAVNLRVDQIVRESTDISSPNYGAFERNAALEDLLDIAGELRPSAVKLQDDPAFNEIEQKVHGLIQRSQSAPGVGGNSGEFVGMFSQVASGAVAKSMDATTQADTAQAREEGWLAIKTWMASKEIPEDSPQYNTIREQWSSWWENKAQNQSRIRQAQGARLAADIERRIRTGEISIEEGRTEANALLAAEAGGIQPINMRDFERVLQAMEESNPFKSQGSAYQVSMGRISQATSMSAESTSAAPGIAARDRLAFFELGRDVTARFNKAFDIEQQRLRAEGADIESGLEAWVNGPGQEILKPYLDRSSQIQVAAEQTSATLNQWRQRFHRMSQSEYEAIAAQHGEAFASRALAENRDVTSTTAMRRAFAPQLDRALTATQSEVDDYVAQNATDDPERDRENRQVAQSIWRRLTKERFYEHLDDVSSSNFEDPQAEISRRMKDDVEFLRQRMKDELERNKGDRVNATGRAEWDNTRAELFAAAAVGEDSFRAKAQELMRVSTSPIVAQGMLDTELYADLVATRKFTRRGPPKSMGESQALEFQQQELTRAEQRWSEHVNDLRARITSSAASDDQKSRMLLELDRLSNEKFSTQSILDGSLDAGMINPYTHRFIDSKDELQWMSEQTWFDAFLGKFGIDTATEAQEWAERQLQHAIDRYGRGGTPLFTPPQVEQQGPQPPAEAVQPPEAPPEPDTSFGPQPREGVQRSRQLFIEYLRRTFPDDRARQARELQNYDRRIK